MYVKCSCRNSYDNVCICIGCIMNMYIAGHPVTLLCRLNLFLEILQYFVLTNIIFLDIRNVCL